VSKVEDSIIIKVTPELIQAALEDVEHAPEWTPSLQKVWDVQGRGAGCSYKWRYKMGPASFEGSTQITQSSPRRFVMHTQGGIPSSWVWTMSPVEGGTELRVTIDYTVPGADAGGLGAKLSEAADKLVIEKQNKKEMAEALTALKARLEG
jgi:uncharacterized membrane protein